MTITIKPIEVSFIFKSKAEDIQSNLGRSKGKLIKRMAIKGFDEPQYYIAVETSKPKFSFFISEDSRDLRRKNRRMDQQKKFYKTLFQNRVRIKSSSQIFPWVKYLQKCEKMERCIQPIVKVSKIRPAGCPN